ncbi:hypothetical protein I4U23_010572 [Adineta vaga]|nr:hypothetical protein I4U23_010572 [Adineta vaga]
MADSTEFIQKLKATNGDVEALSRIECEQKEKRDKADQAVATAKQNGESPGIIVNLKQTATQENFKLNLCSFITELAEKQRDNILLTVRKELNVVLDNMTKEKDAHSSASDLDLSQKQRKNNEDNIGNGETRRKNNVDELIVEQNTMKHVLQTVSYPKLYSLSLMDFQQEVLLDHLKNNTILRKLLSEQVTCLLIDVKHKTISPQLPEILSIVFDHVLDICDMFNTVQCLLMTDLNPFEHNLFRIISHSFPCLKRLHIINDQPQKDRQQSKTSTTFPRLILLNLNSAHADYAGQFLNDKTCHLPCLLNLYIGYQSLALVTKNFTNDATRLICSKLTYLQINEPFVPPKHFYEYFSSIVT